MSSFPNKRKSKEQDENEHQKFKASLQKSGNFIELNKEWKNDDSKVKKEKEENKENEFISLFEESDKNNNINKLEKEIEELKTKIYDLQKNIEQSQKKSNELQKQYDEMQTHFNKILDGKNKQIEELNENSKIEKKEMNEKIQFKNDEIEYLSSQISILKEKNNLSSQRNEFLAQILKINNININNYNPDFDINKNVNKNFNNINNNINANNNNNIKNNNNKESIFNNKKEYNNKNNNINYNMNINNRNNINNNIINNNNINNNSSKRNINNNNFIENYNSHNNNINFINNNRNNNLNLFNNNNKDKKEKYIEIKINPQKQLDIEPIQKYSKPTLIGLQNIGATCFMNSVLQCLSQTKKLTNYFLDEKHKQRVYKNNLALFYPNEYQLSPVYLELIEKLWNKKGNHYYAPYNFMKRVNNMNPLFKKGEAGDAKDFIIFILEQMHKELKKSIKDNLGYINNQMPLNQYDQINTLNNFFQEFTQETSIISDLFFGFNETTNVCFNCKFTYNSKNLPEPICYNYNIFNVIIFPLEEVKNYKNTLNLKNVQNFYMGPVNSVNIDDCFLYNEKTDLFTGENKNYCNICKQLCNSNYTSRIYVSPNILVLILNRGKGNVYKIKMEFTENIDITNYVLQKEKTRLIYKLYGVITHLGESGPNAHFVASCISPVDGRWYRYNDSQVNEIKDFKSEIYNFGVPYILFYEKLD